MNRTLVLLTVLAACATQLRSQERLDDLIEDMRNATLSADFDALAEMIARVRESAPEVADGIQAMADRFDYDGLAALFEE